MYTGGDLQWLWVECDNDTHGSFDTPAQYEYELVVTCVPTHVTTKQICCI